MNAGMSSIVIGVFASSSIGMVFKVLLDIALRFLGAGVPRPYHQRTRGSSQLVMGLSTELLHQDRWNATHSAAGTTSGGGVPVDQHHWRKSQ